MKKLITIILVCVLSLMFVLPLAACGDKGAGASSGDHSVNHPQLVVKKKAKAATCGANGMKEHYFCDYCLKYYEDAECTKEVKRSALFIPATGDHTPGKNNPSAVGNIWYNGIICVKCSKGIDQAAIFCPGCNKQNYTNLGGNSFKCNEHSCGIDFSV